MKNSLRINRAFTAEKHFKLFFACLLMSILSIGQVWATDATLTYSSKYSSNTVLDGTAVTIVNGITATFNKREGGTATQYYTNGTAVRWYGGGTLEIASTIGNITAVEITYTQTANSVSANVGTYSLSDNKGSWSYNTGTSSVTFTQSGTTGQCRISAIKVTYGGSNNPTVLLNQHSTNFLDHFGSFWTDLKNSL